MNFYNLLFESLVDQLLKVTLFMLTQTSVKHSVKRPKFIFISLMLKMNLKTVFMIVHYIFLRLFGVTSH